MQRRSSARVGGASTAMKLIAGLGNPGEDYALTRHNIGFMVIDYLHAAIGLPRFRTEGQALVSRGEWEGEPVGLVKPQSYMNLSGIAIASLVRKYEVPREDLLIISDDTALPFGKIRVRRKGTHGGHNGLRSIIEHLGDIHFPRVRIGVCPTDRTISDMARFVLSPFNKAEREELGEILVRAGDAVKSAVFKGIDGAMSRHN
ncbi:MAG: aminoacyl-tRNA hydrolase [Acidobacteria bacterium]|nr:aminoacyl-tRNA hydrolase [Acidobacteriota bacterium]